MLRKLAVALLAATIVTAPALARGTAAPAATPAKIAVAAGPAKAITTVKAVKHVKKNKRHTRRHANGVKHVNRGAVHAGAKPAAGTRAN